MRVGAIILGISFVAIAVFGFSAMGHQDGRRLGCIAETLQGGNCPTEGAIGVANFYLSAFGKVTQANTATFSTALLVLLFMVAVFAAILSQGAEFGDRSGIQPIRSNTADKPLSLTLRRWLALKETSPNLSF